MDQANTKYSRGYDATGVGLAVCLRHEFALPTAAVDIKSGEKFVHCGCLMAWD